MKIILNILVFLALMTLSYAKTSTEISYCLAKMVNTAISKENIVDSVCYACISDCAVGNI